MEKLSHAGSLVRVDPAIAGKDPIDSIEHMTGKVPEMKTLTAENVGSKTAAKMA